VGTQRYTKVTDERQRQTTDAFATTYKANVT